MPRYGQTAHSNLPSTCEKGLAKAPIPPQTGRRSRHAGDSGSLNKTRAVFCKFCCRKRPSYSVSEVITEVTPGSGVGMTRCSRQSHKGIVGQRKRQAHICAGVFFTTRRSDPSAGLGVLLSEATGCLQKSGFF